MIPIIYYAHSMQIYDTPREAEEMQMLCAYFLDGVIYNPNRPYIQHHQNPMGACLKVVKDRSVSIIAFSHNLLRIPSGVYSEIVAAQKLNKPLYIINQKSITQYRGVMKLTKNDRAKDWARV